MNHPASVPEPVSGYVVLLLDGLASYYPEQWMDDRPGFVGYRSWMQQQGGSVDEVSPGVYEVKADRPRLRS